MRNRASLGFTILTVVTVMGTAGWLLWNSQDPQLADVEFEALPSAAAVDVSADTISNAEQPTSIPLETSTVTVTETEIVDEAVSADVSSAVVIEPANSNNVTDTNTANVTNPTTNTTPTPTPEAEDSMVIVSVIGPDVKERCPVTIFKTTTVHKVMQTASRQCGFSYAGEKQGNLGFFVKEIAGLSQNVKKGYYWIFAVNGEKSQLGVSTRTVEPDDSIQWTYEAEY